MIGYNIYNLKGNFEEPVKSSRAGIEREMEKPELLSIIKHSHKRVPTNRKFNGAK